MRYCDSFALALKRLRPFAAEPPVAGVVTITNAGRPSCQIAYKFAFWPFCASSNVSSRDCSSLGTRLGQRSAFLRDSTLVALVAIISMLAGLIV